MWGGKVMDVLQQFFDLFKEIKLFMEKNKRIEKLDDEGWMWSNIFCECDRPLEYSFNTPARQR